MENPGAAFFNVETGEMLREENHYCGAQIDLETGALITFLPAGEELDIGAFPEGVYHRFDYSLWYRNLEQNVATRIDAYVNR